MEPFQADNSLPDIPQFSMEYLQARFIEETRSQRKHYVTKLNELAPRYQKVGFTFEARQPMEHEPRLNITIKTDTYELQHSTILDVNGASKLVSQFEQLPPTISRFNKFITKLTETYPETSHPYKLRVHPMESEADVELSINVDGRTVRAIIGFNTQLAFINHIALDTELASGQSHYRMRLPGTSTHVTVHSGRSDYSSAYMRDERPFEYGASDTQAMQFINQFVTTMADLGMWTQQKGNTNENHSTNRRPHRSSIGVCRHRLLGVPIR